MPALVLPWLIACNVDNPGVGPARGSLSYPVGVALGGGTSKGGRDVLYVANSNFDLRFNAGSVQAYDLAAIERAIERARCEAISAPGIDAGVAVSDGAVGDADASSGPDAGEMDAGPASDAGEADGGAAEEPALALPEGYETASQYGTLRGILCDGRDGTGNPCCFDGREGRPAHSDFLVRDGEVVIDSFATGLALDPAGRRIYVPVQGRSRLLYIDTNASGALDCGAPGRCTRGPDAADRDLDPDVPYAPQPRALYVGKLSAWAPSPLSMKDDHTFVVTAHQGGEVSLLVDPGPGGPVLHSTVQGGAFANSARFNPQERLLYTTGAAIGSATMRRYGLARDAVHDRFLLVPSTGVSVAVSAGFDIRDVLFDDLDPKRLFALMRGSVQAVLFVERDPSLATEGAVTDVTRVGDGVSRLARETLGGQKLLFVTCFDARAIFVVDESSRELAAVIRGFGGPFDMAIDTVRQHMYVADFRANVVRVVDLKGLADSRLPPPRIVATLGAQRFGGKLK